VAAEAAEAVEVSADAATVADVVLDEVAEVPDDES
jgi:hypothetical protein